jgi:diguanylate cyclase (GGDEF)-like protein
VPIAAIVAGAVFLACLLRVLAMASAAATTAERVEWLLDAAAVALWGTLATLLLRTRPEDPRARLFTATAAAVVATVVYESVPFPDGAGGAVFIWLVGAAVIYSFNPAIVVHMCASIPRRNPLLVRHGWILPAVYAFAGVLATVTVIAMWNALNPFLPWSADLGAVDAVRGRTTLVVYALTGLSGLGLLWYAARREPAIQGRRQALVVFGGLAPWALFMLAGARSPAIVETVVGGILQEVVVLLPAVALFVSIVGYQLFEVGATLRRTVIYGSGIGLLVAAVVVIVDATDTFLAHHVGVSLAGWGVAVLLLVGAMLGQPYMESVARSVDRVFFREREALDALRRRLIPALAERGALEERVSYLVQEISSALQGAPGTLLLADSGEGFFRTRAAVNVESRPAGIPAEWLAPWTDQLAAGAAFAREPEKEAGGLRDALDASRALWIVPIAFNARPIGLLLLGDTPAWKLEQTEADLLQDIARQASAMLENIRLLDLATNDPLTRLPRRHVAEERIAFELERSRRSGRPFGVAMADVDHFKRINDAFGHGAGDLVLCEIAATLASTVRRIDLVARWGGEEFVLVFAEASGEGTAARAETLRAAVQSLEIPIGDSVARPTISLGVCGIAGDAAGVADVVARVDAALYEAKQRGRNRTVTCPHVLPDS